MWVSEKRLAEMVADAVGRQRHNEKLLLMTEIERIDRYEKQIKQMAETLRHQEGLLYDARREISSLKATVDNLKIDRELTR